MKMIENKINDILKETEKKVEDKIKETIDGVDTKAVKKEVIKVMILEGAIEGMIIAATLAIVLKKVL